MKFWHVGIPAAIATVFLASMATAQPLDRDLEAKLGVALQPWLTCLYSSAREAKAAGSTPQQSTSTAFQACGNGEQAINMALSITAARGSAAEKHAAVESLRQSIFEQVQSSVGNLPDFAFRELEAGRDFNMDSSGLRKCEKNGLEVTCTALFDRVANVSAITSYTIYKRQLYQFFIVTERENFPTLIQAFTTKYGAPCRSASKTVQNRLGAEFNSTEITWCFKSGEMVASEIGPRITHSRVIYTDELNAPAVPLPKVDF